jgi:hypothetical protein
MNKTCTLPDLPLSVRAVMVAVSDTTPAVNRADTVPELLVVSDRRSSVP